MSFRRAACLLLILQTSCAYNYAGKEGKVRSEPRRGQDTRVVELKTDPAEEAAAKLAEQEQVVSTSPCLVPTLDLHYFDATSQVVRTMDCTTKKFVNVARTPLGESTYQERRSAGLPEARWYFLVDPSGTKANYPNNDVLLKVSQNFKIEFYGRETGKGMLVYLFLDEAS